MQKVMWNGNVNLELGTGFFIFLTILLLLIVLWWSVGGERMTNVFSGAWRDAVARPTRYARN